MNVNFLRHKGAQTKSQPTKNLEIRHRKYHDRGKVKQGMVLSSNQMHETTQTRRGRGHDT